MQADVIPFGFGPVDLIGVEKKRFSGVAQGEAISNRQSRGALLKGFAAARNSGSKAIEFYWLQYVIDGARFKGADGVFVRRGDENHQRLGPSDFFEQFESIRAGHANIKEEKVGMQT